MQDVVARKQVFRLPLKFVQLMVVRYNDATKHLANNLVVPHDPLEEPNDSVLVHVERLACCLLSPPTVDLEGAGHHPVDLALEFVVDDVVDEGGSQLVAQREHAVHHHAVQQQQVQQRVRVFRTRVQTRVQLFADTGQGRLLQTLVLLPRKYQQVEEEEEEPVSYREYT